MNTVVVWILVAVSSAGTGRSGFAVPAFSPALASAEDCKQLLQAAQRVIAKSDGRSNGPAMECVAVHMPLSTVSVVPAPSPRRK
jgi:hypothetical protein